MTDERSIDGKDAQQGHVETHVADEEEGKDYISMIMIAARNTVTASRTRRMAMRRKQSG